LTVWSHCTLEDGKGDEGKETGREGRADKPFDALKEVEILVGNSRFVELWTLN
jgi:hypothetical protein